MVKLQKSELKSAITAADKEGTFAHISSHEGDEMLGRIFLLFGLWVAFVAAACSVEPKQSDSLSGDPTPKPSSSRKPSASPTVAPSDEVDPEEEDPDDVPTTTKPKSPSGSVSPSPSGSGSASPSPAPSPSQTAGLTAFSAAAGPAAIVRTAGTAGGANGCSGGACHNATQIAAAINNPANNAVGGLLSATGAAATDDDVNRKRLKAYVYGAGTTCGATERLKIKNKIRAENGVTHGGGAKLNVTAAMIDSWLTAEGCGQ